MADEGADPILTAAKAERDTRRKLRLALHLAQDALAHAGRKMSDPHEQDNCRRTALMAQQVLKDTE